MRSKPKPSDDGFWPLVFPLLMAASCQTYTAVVEAPVEFWVTAETIVGAFLFDLWTIVEWLL